MNHDMIMMKTRTKRILSMVPIAAVFLVGCRSTGDVRSSGRSDGTDEGGQVLHAWTQVVEVRGEGLSQVRQHVGYVHKRYSEDNPDGIWFVLDPAHSRRGFILPTGQVYAFEARESEVPARRALGNFAFENGVREILGVSGTLEFQPIAEASSGGTARPAPGEGS